MPVIATQDLSCGYTLSLSAGHLRHQPDNYHWLDSPVKHASHCHSGPLNWGHDHSFRHIPTHVHISGSLDHGQSDQRVYHGASPRARSTRPQCQHLWHTRQVRHAGFSYLSLSGKAVCSALGYDDRVLHLGSLALYLASHRIDSNRCSLLLSFLILERFFNLGALHDDWSSLLLFAQPVQSITARQYRASSCWCQ